MFESSSWDSDDRVVFGNLRAGAQQWAFPPTEDQARKEGFGFQSVHSFIYITYFHRQDSFKGRRGLFSDFQYALAPAFYFPALSPAMYLFPERRSPSAPHAKTLCLLLKVTVIVLLFKCGESDGRLRDCFASPVFQWGSINRRGMIKDNNGAETLEQLRDERFGLLATETLRAFVENSLCFLFLIEITCALPGSNDEQWKIVMAYCFGVYLRLWC